MKCPNDNTDLQMTERQGVEVDYCSQCRGVWLDRGELDKIIDKVESSANTAPPYNNPQTPPPAQYPQPQPPYGYDKHGGYGKHGRKSLLRELFD